MKFLLRLDSKIWIFAPNLTNWEFEFSRAERLNYRKLTLCKDIFGCGASLGFELKNEACSLVVFFVIFLNLALASCGRGRILDGHGVWILFRTAAGHFIKIFIFQKAFWTFWFTFWFPTFLLFPPLIRSPIRIFCKSAISLHFIFLFTLQLFTFISVFCLHFSYLFTFQLFVYISSSCLHFI